MPAWERSVEISASPARVWEVMSEVSKWPEWTASIVSVEAPSAAMGLGSQADVQARGAPKARWTVTVWRPGEGFTWVTKVRGARTIAGHEIVPVGDGNSRVTLSIEVPGLMATLLKPVIGKQIVENLELESQGLKKRSEAVLSS